MTVIVAGNIDFEPEDVAVMLETARPHIEGAYTEKGCVHYIWTPDPHRPGRVQVFEEWETSEDLSAHLSSHWYADMRAHMGKFRRTGASVRKYRVDLSEPVYDATGKARGDFFTA
jgi:quinol monooxygenase YgiN